MGDFPVNPISSWSLDTVDRPPRNHRLFHLPSQHYTPALSPPCQLLQPAEKSYSWDLFYPRQTVGLKPELSCLNKLARPGTVPLILCHVRPLKKSSERVGYLRSDSQLIHHQTSQKDDMEGPEKRTRRCRG